MSPARGLRHPWCARAAQAAEGVSPGPRPGTHWARPAHPALPRLPPRAGGRWHQGVALQRVTTACPAFTRRNDASLDKGGTRGYSPEPATHPQTCGHRLPGGPGPVPRHRPVRGSAAWPTDARRGLPPHPVGPCAHTHHPWALDFPTTATPRGVSQPWDGLVSAPQRLLVPAGDRPPPAPGVCTAGQGPGASRGRVASCGLTGPFGSAFPPVFVRSSKCHEMPSKDQLSLSSSFQDILKTKSGRLRANLYLDRCAPALWVCECVAVWLSGCLKWLEVSFVPRPTILGCACRETLCPSEGSASSRGRAWGSVGPRGPSPAPPGPRRGLAGEIRPSGRRPLALVAAPRLLAPESGAAGTRSPGRRGVPSWNSVATTPV